MRVPKWTMLIENHVSGGLPVLGIIHKWCPIFLSNFWPPFRPLIRFLPSKIQFFRPPPPKIGHHLWPIPKVTKFEPISLLFHNFVQTSDSLKSSFLIGQLYEKWVQISIKESVKNQNFVLYLARLVLFCLVGFSVQYMWYDRHFFSSSNFCLVFFSGKHN